MVETSANQICGVDLKESEVGICRFLAEKDAKLNDFIQLNATFKHRFSDFIVNEIDEKGEVVWYKSENNALQFWKMSNFDNQLPEKL
jgi:hypothetical protein